MFGSRSSSLLGLFVPLFVGCPAGSEPDAMTEPNAPTSEDSESGCGTGSGPGDTTSPIPDLPGDTGSDGGGGLPPFSTCGDQPDPASCATARDSETGRPCGWAVPIHYAPRTCEIEPFDAATCLPTLELEGCDPPPATCSDGSAWYFRTIGHSLEVIDASSTCFDLSDFDPCPAETPEPSSDTDTDTDTDGGESSGGWSIDELIAAVCACPCSPAVAEEMPGPGGDPIPGGSRSHLPKETRDRASEGTSPR